VTLVCRRSSYSVLNAFTQLVSRLDVTVNLEKTRTRTLQQGFEFLGFEFVKRRSPTHGRSVIYLFPSKTSQAEIRRRIRRVSCRNAPIPPEVFLAQINRMTRGWAAYYRYTNGALIMRRLQEFICHRTRRYFHY